MEVKKDREFSEKVEGIAKIISENSPKLKHAKSLSGPMEGRLLRI